MIGGIEEGTGRKRSIDDKVVFGDQIGFLTEVGIDEIKAVDEHGAKCDAAS